MTLTLRPAVAEDLPAVGALHHRSRLATYSVFLPAGALAAPPAASMGQWWAERWWCERDSHVMTLAEQDGELVGFSYHGPDDLGDPAMGLLNAIHVAPGHVRTGVGRTLMVDALAALHGQGRRSAALWVYADNASARDFYERGGWRSDGSARTEQLGGCDVQQLRYTRRLP